MKLFFVSIVNTSTYFSFIIQPNSMAGIIVQLLLSWIIIWFYQKNNLRVLGLQPSWLRAIDFFLFLIITAFCCASGFLLRMYFGQEKWQLNPELSSQLILSGIWWNIKSVLFEELIFRGVLLYILIKQLGSVKAIIISASCFGIYHWFSFEVFGNISQMIIVFFITGIMGLVYAFGYAKTYSLYIPIAIHLGWNFTRGFVFSEGNIGNGILIPAKPQPIVTVSYFVYFTIQILPILSAVLINFFLLKLKKQVVVDSKKIKRI